MNPDPDAHIRINRGLVEIYPARIGSHRRQDGWPAIEQAIARDQLRRRWSRQQAAVALVALAVAVIAVGALVLMPETHRTTAGPSLEPSYEPIATPVSAATAPPPNG